MATYLSAKENGFNGSYSEWVNSGRPDGNNGEGISSGEKTNIALAEFKKKYNQNNLPISDRAKNLIFMAQNYANTVKDQIGRSRADGSKVTEEQALGYAMGNINWDYVKGSVPENEIKLLQNLVPAFINQTFGKTEAQNQIDSLVNQFTGGNAQGIGQENQQNADGRFGTDPKTGKSMTITQAYNKARSANPGLTFTQFQANPDQYLSGAGIDVVSADNSQNGGGISGTGVPYTTWAAQQKAAGKPSSYQDWKNAGQASVATTATGNQPSEPIDSTKAALDSLLASPFYQNLPEDQKALMRMTVQSWDPDAEINMENVLAKFDEIKKNTIDPQFKEQVDVFTKDVQDQYNTLQSNRAMELESERSLAGQNIRQARGNLEQRGMTFSGQGIETLGAESAYAQKGDSAIPLQREVGANENLTDKAGMTFTDGGKFFEGTVGQANRLMSTSSMQRYLDNIKSLGRSAENVLGGAGAAKLVGGFSPAGVSTGSIEQARQQQLGSTLSQLAGQQGQNNQYKQPVDFQNFNNSFQ